MFNWRDRLFLSEVEYASDYNVETVLLTFRDLKGRDFSILVDKDAFDFFFEPNREHKLQGYGAIKQLAKECKCSVIYNMDTRKYEFEYLGTIIYNAEDIYIEGIEEASPFYYFIKNELWQAVERFIKDGSKCI